VILCICNNLTPQELSKLTPEEYEEIVQCGKCRDNWKELRDDAEGGKVMKRTLVYILWDTTTDRMFTPRSGKFIWKRSSHAKNAWNASEARSYKDKVFSKQTRYQCRELILDLTTYMEV